MTVAVMVDSRHPNTTTESASIDHSQKAMLGNRSVSSAVELVIISS